MSKPIQLLEKTDLPMSVLPQYNQPKWQTTRSRRSILVYVASILALLWAGYSIFQLSSEKPIPTILSGETNEHSKNVSSALSVLIKLIDLPPHLIPQTGKNRKPGRLIVVGDVHGMKHDLLHLLRKIKFNEKTDHLILAGDLVSKGPDSLGVVDLAMELGAMCIRGNHEDHVIHAWDKMQMTPTLQENSTLDRQSSLGALETDRVGLYQSHKALAKALGETRMKWLQECPVIMRVGHLNSIGKVAVVHAGLVPGIALENQDPTTVMNMRTIRNGVPSEKRNGKAWSKVWNKYQKTLPKAERTTVIYGHDARRGLKQKNYSIGIDTGCVGGNKLTAAVIAGGSSDHTYSLVHVKCKDWRSR